MDFKQAAKLGSYLAKDYAENLFRLLINYHDISASEAASRLNLHIKTVQDFLEGMTELGIISKSGALYSVTDAVFRMWIEVKSKPRNLCFDFMPEHERADYTDEIQERIAYFHSERKKSLDKRIIELISSFNDDQFFIDERVRLLPRVGTIELKHFDGNSYLITIKEKKRRVFVVSYKEVTEEDVYAVFSKIKSFKYNKPKIVLLAPIDIKAPAKLLAKQKQFCIWTKKDMARLFEFYKGYNALIA